MDGKSCCAPPRGGTTQVHPPISGHGSYLGDVINIPGGKALVGTNRPMIKVDGEGPQRTVRVKPFALGKTAVSNLDFQNFVSQTGFQTDAEIFGWSFVFHAHVPKETGHTDGIVGAEWWRRVEGANWRTPFGPYGGDACDPNLPVTHVSWNDARAFANWVGGRLPTEPEWEHAARGGLGDVTYPWGDQAPDDTDHFPCNIWQGDFPHVDTGADGFAGPAPVTSYLPNGFGLFNMVGNVWEWCAEDFRNRSLSKAGKAHAKAMRHHKLIKGGSFLCHESYCTRYRIAARTGNTPDSSTSHTGFRVAFDTSA